jgi:ABC-2 type transport system ATP-binding protein
VNDPDVLFLDEPTTGIDPAGRRDVWQLVDGLTAGGTTVFLTSHSMAEVERLADRVGLLRDGALVTTGSPSALVAEHGGENTLIVETGTVDDATAALDGSYTVSGTSDGVVVRGVSPREIGDVASALEGAGVTYGSLTWSEPSLEDVYLSLTGEAFEARDEDGSAVPAPGIDDGVLAAGAGGRSQ